MPLPYLTNPSEVLTVEPIYSVVVGNVGEVWSTFSRDTAESVYREYVRQSRAGIGRGSNESVVLFCDGEIEEEHRVMTEDA